MTDYRTGRPQDSDEKGTDMKDLNEMAEMTSLRNMEKHKSGSNGFSSQNGGSDSPKDSKEKGEKNSNMKSLFYPDVADTANAAAINGNVNGHQKMEQD